MKKYKAVAGPQNVSVKKGQSQEAFDLFAEIINHEAREGWEYHSMETISVTENPGCSFLGQPSTFHYYMLIFSKDI